MLSMAARALHRCRLPTIVETLDAANAAIFAAAKSNGAGSACAAMNNDMVKPMPASAPAVASWRHEYSSGLVAQFNRTAGQCFCQTPPGVAASLKPAFCVARRPLIDMLT